MARGMQKVLAANTLVCLVFDEKLFNREKRSTLLVMPTTPANEMNTKGNNAARRSELLINILHFCLVILLFDNMFTL